MIRHKSFVAIGLSIALTAIGVHNYKISSPKQPSSAAGCADSPYFDTMTSTNFGTSVPGLTNSITIGSNPNRVLYVCVATDAPGDSLANCTLSGTAMTKIAEFIPGVGKYMAIFRLINPASGAGEIRATWTSMPGQVIAIAYHGIDQTTPNDSPQDAQDSGVTVSFRTVTSGGGDFVLDFVSVDTGLTLTESTNQCVKTNVQGGGVTVGVSVEAGVASTDMRWTWSGAQEVSHSAMNINIAPSTTVAFQQGATASQDSGGGPTVAPVLTGVTIGEALFAFVGWEGGGTITAPVESGGTGSASTWTSGTVNVHDAGTEPAVRVFYTASAQMSGSVTYTFGETGNCSYKRAYIARISYTGGTFQLDASDHDNEGTSSGTLISGAITTTGSTVIVFAGVKGYTALTLTSEQIGGAAAILVAADQSDAACWYRITTLSSGTATISADASDRWCLPIYSFKVQ